VIGGEGNEVREFLASNFGTGVGWIVDRETLHKEYQRDEIQPSKDDRLVYARPRQC
jgi:hypothetical protein